MTVNPKKMIEDIASLTDVRIGYQEGLSKDNNVVSMVKRHALLTPDHLAIRWVPSDESEAFSGDIHSLFSEGEITFKGIYESAARIASGLLKLGIEKGDRVVLFLPMGVGMYASMFALQQIGAAAVFLDSWARRSHLGATAACVEPKAMISFKAAFDLVEGIPEFGAMPLRIIAGAGNEGQFDASLEDLFVTDGMASIEPVEAEDTALITFTTGSSGIPKGADRSHRFLCSQHEALKKVIPYLATDTDIPAFPIFSLNNLASGVTTMIPALNLAEPRETDAAALVNQFIHQGISCTTLSPFMLNNISKFCRENGIQLDGIRRVVTGGAPISKDNIRDFKEIARNAEIWILYGSTEVEPMAHIEANVMLACEENADSEVIAEGVNVGVVDSGLKYKFIKATADDIHFEHTSWQELEVNQGEVGEFIVSGEHVCERYFNNKEAFHKTKIQEPDGRVWHRTGDLAKIDKNRHLWIVGRIHNMILRKQQYFFPVSAEIILKRCEFIKQGAFVGLEDTDLGQRTVVAVVFTDDAFNNRQFQVNDAVNEVMRLFDKNHIIVDSFYSVDSIPMDPRHHSKVEYALLREDLQKQVGKDLL